MDEDRCGGGSLLEQAKNAKERKNIANGGSLKIEFYILLNTREDTAMQCDEGEREFNCGRHA